MAAALLERATERLQDNTVLADSFDQVREILEPVAAERGGGKFVMAHIQDDPATDAQIKALKATVHSRSVIAKAY